MPKYLVVRRKEGRRRQLCREILDVCSFVCVVGGQREKDGPYNSAYSSSCTYRNDLPLSLRTRRSQRCFLIAFQGSAWTFAHRYQCWTGLNDTKAMESAPTQPHNHHSPHTSTLSEMLRHSPSASTYNIAGSRASGSADCRRDQRMRVAHPRIDHRCKRLPLPLDQVLSACPRMSIKRSYTLARRA
jgi:hypothetical protein